jgi:Effector Associated Constant Component 1
MSRDDGTDVDPRNLLIELRLVPDADSGEAERFGRQLRAELAQLDVEAVSPMVSADVAQGAKGAGVDWGSLLVTLSGVGGVVTSVIAVVQDWLGRHSAAQSIKVTIDGDTIDLGRASAQEREELISAWVRRHSGA